jgi:acyl carrier protein
MLDREALRQSLRGYLEEDTGEPLASFDDDVNLRDGLGLDSVDVMGLVMQVERQLRIRLPSEELVGLVTVGDLLSLLQAKTAAAAGDDGNKDAA